MSSYKKNELLTISSKNAERVKFINGIEFHNLDGDIEFYRKFITKNYSSEKTDFLIGLMELSIKIRYFKKNFFFHLLPLYPKKRFWYRLAFLDYLFNFRNKINKSIFIKINEEIFKNSKNLEIKFQACLNLFSVKYSYGNNLLEMISKAGKKSNHYILYRAAQFLSNFKNGKYKKVKDKLLEVLNTTTLPISQKDELTQIISK